MQKPNEAEEASLPAASSKKAYIVNLLLFFWLLLSLIGLASLSYGHIVAMPKPENEARFTQSILRLRSTPRPYFIVHVIYEHCSCTESLFEHLLKRKASVLEEELILFVGEDEVKERKARASGYRFVHLSATDLEVKHGLESAPILVVLDLLGQIKYLGGYYKHPSAIFPLDQEVWEEIKVGKRPDSLPIFGCAVSKKLQNKVDPLGLVY